jgi:hypothetical protein
MTDFSYYHAYTAKAGSSRYRQPLGRFECEVWHDQSRFVYDLHQFATSYREGATVKGKGKFRDFVKRCWIKNHFGDERKLTGRWPSYYID